ncbi:MAG: hypothetical protein DMG93_11720 [Acidobacteria bacterium]|nr:MAG: hypothetical protein DMG93_11720 [Acidobacteriota bacterium]
MSQPDGNLTTLAALRSVCHRFWGVVLEKQSAGVSTAVLKHDSFDLLPLGFKSRWAISLPNLRFRASQ